jgi:hypothetical protein
LAEDTYTAKERQFAREILLYLRRNPDAKDTLAGIAQCWLGLSSSGQTLNSVERAVVYLLSKEMLFEKRRSGLPAYYGMNASKSKEVFTVLELLDQ